MQAINRKYRQLTSVQAALVINFVYNSCGLDKIGDTYGKQGYAIAQEMRLFNGNAHIRSQRVRDARNFTAWSLFNIDTYVLSISIVCYVTKVRTPVFMLGTSFAFLFSPSLPNLCCLMHL